MLKICNQTLNDNLEQAALMIKAGKLVAFPTETVYGLGADARNEIAIQKVFSVKNRPTSHPLIVHLPSSRCMIEWATDIPKSAWALAATFWPGPLTLVLKRHPSVSTLITAGQETIALRVPRHSLTLKFLQKVQGALVGPSANSFGRISPTLASHVKADLGAKVDYVLNGGRCAIGIESTIVYIDNLQARILRYGAISPAAISKVLGFSIKKKCVDMCIRVPGDIKSHYAPKNSLYLVAPSILTATIRQCVDAKNSCAVLSFQIQPLDFPFSVIWYTVAKNARLYAKNIYVLMRKLDKKVNKIFIEMPPRKPEWQAVLDRLRRASTDVISS